MNKQYPRHMTFNLDMGERTDTDVRIAAKIKQVKVQMGDAFMEWYKQTPFSDEALERVLDEKLDEFAMQEQEWGALEILVGYIPPEPEQQADEQQADADWLMGWNEPTFYIKLSPENRSEFQVHQNGNIRYYRNARSYALLEKKTQPVMFSGGLRILK